MCSSDLQAVVRRRVRDRLGRIGRDVDGLRLVRNEVESGQPIQRLLDFFGVESCGAEFASQLVQFRAGLARPEIFVNVNKHIEHVPQYNLFLGKCRQWPRPSHGAPNRRREMGQGRDHLVRVLHQKSALSQQGMTPSGEG